MNSSAIALLGGGAGTVIDSCAFQRLDGNAIMINGYARGTVIQNSDFHEIGDNMIAQLGETTGDQPAPIKLSTDILSR